MNKAIAKYRRQVIRSMHCSKHTRDKLLGKLDALLSSFQEEEPDADAEKIIQSFGAPSDFADSLCEGISKDERRRWKWRQRTIIGVSILLCIGLIVSLSYLITMHFAESPVYIIQETYIHDNPS